MKVNDGNQGPRRPERPNEPSKPRILPIGQEAKILPIGQDAQILPVGQEATSTTARIERLDRVEISAAGRARAAKVDPVSTDSADRIAQIRRRVLEGAYNADAVVADVARRIIDRGDV